MLKLLLFSSIVTFFFRFLTYLDKDKDRELKAKKIIARTIWAFYWTSIVYLLYNNWSAILYPPSVDKVDGLLSHLLKTQGLVQLLITIAFVACMGILSFALRFVFETDWEQVKIFGFEYKRLIKETNQAAKAEIEFVRDLDKLRSALFETLTSTDGYELVKDSIEGQQFYSVQALDSILELISATFELKMDIKIETAVIPVESGVPNPSFLYRLTPEGQRLAYAAAAERITKYSDDNSILVVPMTIKGNVDSNFAVVLRSAKYRFTESDEKLLSTVENVVNTYAQMVVFEALGQTGEGAV